jgi:hypothetical protein
LPSENQQDREGPGRQYIRITPKTGHMTIKKLSELEHAPIGRCMRIRSIEADVPGGGLIEEILKNITKFLFY